MAFIEQNDERRMFTYLQDSPIRGKRKFSECREVEIEIRIKIEMHKYFHHISFAAYRDQLVEQ